MKEEKSTMLKAALPQTPGDGGSRPRVLVVDDDPEIRRAIQRILADEFAVTALETGHIALERIRAGEVFDVVSLDLQLPGALGVDVLKDIKKLNPFIEVLILTAHSDLNSAKKAVRFGAYDYLDKPFKNEAYREAIRRGVTRRKEMHASQKAREQLEFVKAQLKESEKFAVIGQLIAGVVHELNNALNSVIGFADLLMMEQALPEKTQKYLKGIHAGAELSQNIVRKLLAFSRKQDAEKKPTLIQNVVQSTLDLKRNDLRIDEIDAVQDIKDDMPPVFANFHEIQQVCLNIMTNAHQAMKDTDGERRLIIEGEWDQQNVRIRFQDTGVGIPHKNLQKIFEPLFTTKAAGVGTGLGLSVCYDIVQNHGGTLYVASEPGQGACFIVELPVSPGGSSRSVSPVMR